MNEPINIVYPVCEKSVLGISKSYGISSKSDWVYQKNMIRKRKEQDLGTILVTTMRHFHFL